MQRKCESDQNILNNIKFSHNLTCEKKSKSDEKAANVVKYECEGNYCVSGGSDRLIHLWNLKCNSLITSFSGHSWDIYDIAMYFDLILFLDLLIAIC